LDPLRANPQEEDPLDPIQDIAPDDICEVLFDDYIEYSTSSKGSQDPILVRDAFVKLCS